MLLPALIAVCGAVEILGAGYQPWWLTVGVFLLAAGVLSMARVAPLVVPPVVAAIYATTPLLGVDVSQPASWVALLAAACFSTGLHTRRKRQLAGLASVLLALAITHGGIAWLTTFTPSVLFGLIMGVGSWALGLSLRRALDQNRYAGAQTERERIETALRVQRAIDAERDRIAVELPDVLAHCLGAMVLQASAAGDLVRREPEAAVRSLHNVAKAGRNALTETGRLLRLLRDDRDELGLRPDAVAAGTVVLARPASSLTSRRADWLLPSLFGVLATIELVVGFYRPLWTSLGAYWLAVGLLFARRTLPLGMPLGVLGVAVGARLLGANTDDPAAWILIIALACFSAGHHVPRSRTARGLASVIAAVALLALDSAVRGELSADLVLVLPFAVAPWGVGVALREVFDRTRVLAAKAERTRLEGELAAERAAATERRRIARELHDVLANSLNVMIVQAALAADLVIKDPDRAIRAVTEVECCGRTALADTGHLLHLIRADDVTTHPQHGVADIPSLAAGYTHAGLGVTLEMDNVAHLPVGVDMSIYHIVREALTNALKHAPGSPVSIRLAQARFEIAVEVRNGPAPSSRLATLPSGHGLIGLQERVSVFGGSLVARPTTDGGFLLTATMPVVGAE
jgi:signal transduction histidine kinase